MRTLKGDKIPHITGATLLSSSEVNAIDDLSILKFGHQWWLRNKGDSKYIADVSSNGVVYAFDDCIYVGGTSAIRPVLIIDNLGEFEIGARFKINNFEFKVVLENYALSINLDLNKHRDIIWSEFNDKTGYTLYDDSNVKKVINEWYIINIERFIVEEEEFDVTE